MLGLRTRKLNKSTKIMSVFVATLYAGTCSVAYAQQTTPPIPAAPVFPNVDENGVDLSTGRFEYSITAVSIGQGDAALDATLKTANGVWRVDSFKGYITASYSSPLITVTLDGDSETFTTTGWPNGAITSNQNEGSTLQVVQALNEINQYVVSKYIYTRADGTVATFAVDKYPNGVNNGSKVSAALVLLQFPSGKIEEFDYRIIRQVIGTPQGPMVGTHVSNIQSVKNNFGYQIRYFFDAPGSPKVKSVTAINNGIDHCAPNAEACSFTQSAATALLSASVPGGTNFVNVMTDPLGQQTSFTLNGSLLTGIRRPGSPTNNISIGYAGAGLVSSVTNEGVAFQYNFAASGGVMTMTRTNFQGNTLVVVTNQALGRPSSVKDEANRMTTYQYDGAGRMTRVTYPEGNYVAYAYDPRGNTISETRVAKAGSGLASISVSAAFPASCTNRKTCNNPVTSTDALGSVTDYTYDATTGYVTSVTPPAPTTGAVRPQTRYAYTNQQAYYKNAAGSIVASGQPITLLQSVSECRSTASCAGGADETRTSISYGPQGAGTANNLLPVAITTASGDNTLSATANFAYDNAGNRIAEDGPLAGPADTTRHRFDLARQQVGVVTPDPDGTGPAKHVAQRFTYNVDGQVTSSDLGNVNSPSDADWNAMTVSQSSVTTYDSLARPVKQELKSGGTTYAVAQTKYDSLGRVDCTAQRMDAAQWNGQADACVPQTNNTVFGPDRVSKASYTAASEISQVQTAFGTVDQSVEASYSYSSNGMRLTAQDAENNLTTYVYDGHDRLSQIRYPLVSKGANASNTSDYEQYTFDANDNATQARLRDGTTINLTYDKLNRLIAKDTPNLAHFDYDISYQYDLQGRRTRAVTAPGHANTFVYDALGRMTTQGMYNTATYHAYDIAGRRNRMTWADGNYVDYVRDTVGNVTSIRENGAGSGAGLLATYAYDNLGRRSSVARGNATVTTYGYDAVSRLSSLGHDLGGSSHDHTVSLTYNPAGQIDTATGSNDAYAWNGHYNVDRLYGSNGLNQFTTAGTTGFGYDPRGNLTISGGQAYTYTAENRMATSSGGSYLGYEPSGNQILQHYNSSTGADLRFGWDGDRISMEIGANTGWNVLRRYVPGPGVDETLVWYEGAGLSDRRWLHADERGSVVAVTNASGAALAINRYDEYGIPGAANIGRFQYTGQAWLPEIGIYYYKARMYSPTLGRFMQTDPIGYGDGMNLYNYVGSDPVNNIDPSGLNATIVLPPPPASIDTITVTGTRLARPEPGIPGGFFGGFIGLANWAPTPSPSANWRPDAGLRPTSFANAAQDDAKKKKGKKKWACAGDVALGVAGGTLVGGAVGAATGAWNNRNERFSGGNANGQRLYPNNSVVGGAERMARVAARRITQATVIGSVGVALWDGYQAYSNSENCGG